MEQSILWLSAGSAWLLILPLAWILRRAGVIDRPNARSSHRSPTVRGAGTGIVLVVAGFMAWDVGSRPQGILLALFLGLAAVSFVDDLRGMRPFWRFAVQTFAAVMAMVVFGSGIDQPMAIRLLLGLVGWLWIAGYTNAFNFMDGINGLAAVQAITTGLGTAILAITAGVGVGHPIIMIALAVAGAAMGFLPHNFPRARVFMGDVGSAPLGFLLAVLAVWIAHETSPQMLFWLALLHANFVLDTGITLARRSLRRERLDEAHREHFYQRLVRSGYSHVRVTLIQAGLQVVVVVALWLATPMGLGAKLVVGAGVIALWLAFFAFAELKFRAAAVT